MGEDVQVGLLGCIVGAEVTLFIGSGVDTVICPPFVDGNEVGG